MGKWGLAGALRWAPGHVEMDESKDANADEEGRGEQVISAKEAAEEDQIDSMVQEHGH